MDYIRVAALLISLTVVRFGLGFTFQRAPVAFSVLTAGFQLIFQGIWTISIAPQISPLRKFPRASQGPWWRTFLKEPDPSELERYMNDTPNDGLIRFFGVFHGERLLITKPQGTKEMLLLRAYNFNKLAHVKNLIGQVTGEGLIIADQDEHKRQRKSLLPAFKFKYIKNLFPRFWFHTRELLDAMGEEIRETGGISPAVVDVDGWMMRVTLDIVAAAGFGVDTDAIRHPENELAKILPEVNSTKPSASFYRVLAFLLPEWMYLRLPMERRYEMDRIVKAIDDTAMSVIRSRRKAFAKKTPLDPDAGEEQDSQTFADTDVISTLLRFAQPFTDRELISQSASILVAGQDTTSVATTWALYLLAHHPEMQSSLRAEIRNYLPSPSEDGTTIDAALVESMPYLAAVCSETLRLFPPAPLLRRQVVKPDTVILGEHVSVGTVLVTSIWGTHHLKRIWGPDANEFKPDRFLQHTDDGKTKFDQHAGLTGEEANYCYLPFGAGMRACIGERFAKGEFATLLAGVVGRFEWTLNDPDKKMGEDVKINFGIVTKPEGGLLLRARRVSGW